MKIDKKKYPNSFRGHQYALDIISGKIAGCIYLIGACKRYLSDLESDKFYFDLEAAEKYLRSVQKFEHVKGHWPTKNIVYEPWQCWVKMNIYGFRNKETGYRRFRIAHLEVARGNAKSAMASQCSLYELALDNPNGNEISAVATKKEQARIVLDSSRAMALKNSSYRKHTGVKVLAHAISHPASVSKMVALAADSKSLDGLNDILAVCDELHAMDRELFEVITSGMSKRSDSLVLCITTAGSNVDSVGHSQSTYAKKICLGEHQDDTFFAAVYTLDKEDDWEDEKVWIKANPNLGVSVDITTLRAKIDKASITPADIAGIKVKHFNMWISEANAFYDQNVWDKCADRSLKMEDFRGSPARMGIDLASHIDLTSIATVFRKDGIYYIFDKTFLPEATIGKIKNDMYEDCVAKGYLIATKGEAINYEYIREQMIEIADAHRIQECLYDAWNATETAQKMSSKIEMVKIAMNVANLSEPMKKLDALMREGKLKHNGSPLLRWCLGNVVAKEDHNGNVFPRKSHSKLKIDPILAVIMALAGWLQNVEKDSVYEHRDIRVL